MIESRKKLYTAPRVDNGRIDFNSVPKAEIDCYPWDNGNGYRPYAYGQVVHDGESLFVRLVCHEPDPLVTYDKPNQPVYEDSCLEFFINPLPGRNTFVDFELNAAGVLLLGHYKDGGFRLLEPAARPSFDIQSGINGAENRWSVQLRIPVAFLQEVFEFADCPERMEANFYKCGDKTARPHFGCWNPIPPVSKLDFFRPDCFGTLVLTP